MGKKELDEDNSVFIQEFRKFVGKKVVVFCKGGLRFLSSKSGEDPEHGPIIAVDIRHLSLIFESGLMVRGDNIIFIIPEEKVPNLKSLQAMLR